MSAPQAPGTQAYASTAWGLMQGTRLFFANTLWRVVTPLREVTWADFLLADVLTSLAKPLSDCERAVCHLLTGPVLLPASTEQVCTAVSHRPLHIAC